MNYSDLVHFGIFAVPVGVVAFVAATSIMEGLAEKRSKAHNKSYGENHASAFPELLIQNMCRDIAIADGKDPDHIAAGKTQPQWCDYRREALFFLAAGASLVRYGDTYGRR